MGLIGPRPQLPPGKLSFDPEFYYPQYAVVEFLKVCLQRRTEEALRLIAAMQSELETIRSAVGVLEARVTALEQPEGNE